MGAAFVVFAALDVSPVRLTGVVEFDSSDIVPKILACIRMLGPVAHVQHAFLFLEHVCPFRVRIIAFRERLCLFASFAMAVALRAAYVWHRTIRFHRRVIFGIAETIARWRLYFFPRVAGCEGKVLVHDRAPSCRVLLDEGAQHARKIAGEWASEYFREVLTESRWIAVPNDGIRLGMCLRPLRVRLCFGCSLCFALLGCCGFLLSRQRRAVQEKQMPFMLNTEGLVARRKERDERITAERKA